MDKADHAEFLAYVQAYVTANPGCGAFVSEFVAKGIENARKADMDRALDMECALSIALARRFKAGDGIILDKLKKWEGNSCLNWSSTIEAIESRLGGSNGQS